MCQPYIESATALSDVQLILAYDCPCPHESGKALHLMDRKEMAYT